jgi:hypothetical protein
VHAREGALEGAARRQRRRHLHAEQEAQLVELDALLRIVDGDDELAGLLEHGEQALLQRQFLRHARGHLGRDLALVEVDEGQALERRHDARHGGLVGVAELDHRLVESEVAALLQRDGLAQLLRVHDAARDELFA